MVGDNRGSVLIVIACSALAVWDEKCVEEYEKENNKSVRDQTKHKLAGKFIVNVLICFYIFFFSFLLFQNEGQMVSKPNF